MGEKLTVGLIGFGSIVQDEHVRVLKALKNRFEVVAVSTRNRPSLQVAEKAYPDAAASLGYQGVLENSTVQVVSIAVPAFLTATVAMDAVRKGKHVILERPLAGNIEDARNLLTAVKGSGKKVLVAEKVLFSPVYEKVCELLKRNTVGKLRMVHVEKFERLTNQSAYMKCKWRQKPKHMGGPMGDIGISYVSIVRSICGPLKTVTGACAAINRNLGQVDTVFGNLYFKTGVLAHIAMGFSSEGLDPHMDFCCEKGTIRVMGGSVKIVTPGETRDLPCKSGDPALAMWTHFADVLCNKAKPRYPHTDAYKDLDTIWAVLRSARTSKPVKF